MLETGGIRNRTRVGGGGNYRAGRAGASVRDEPLLSGNQNEPEVGGACWGQREGAKEKY